MSPPAHGNGDQNQLERLLQLLTDRAIQGLTVTQERELQSLLTVFPDLDENALDATAAAIELAFSLPQEPLPQHIGAAIAQQCSRHFAMQAKQPALNRQSPESAAQKIPSETASTPDPDGIIAIPSKRRSRIRKNHETAWLSWGVAGFFLLLALLGWWPRLFPAVASSEVKTPRQMREEFRGSARDIIEMQWKVPTETEEKNITGSVVWSNAAQRGYILLNNLPANIPAEQQYQLWIIDAARGDQYPVSAAVFNATGNDTVIVAIDPVLGIKQPTQFTITLESAGGVVVSDAQALLTTTGE
jgi:hypothetical protein